jgi:hypothetical protein
VCGEVTASAEETKTRIFRRRNKYLALSGSRVSLNHREKLVVVYDEMMIHVCKEVLAY